MDIGYDWNIILIYSRLLHATHVGYEVINIIAHAKKSFKNNDPNRSISFVVCHVPITRSLNQMVDFFFNFSPIYMVLLIVATSIYRILDVSLLVLELPNYHRNQDGSYKHGLRMSQNYHLKQIIIRGIFKKV